MLVQKGLYSRVTPARFFIDRACAYTTFVLHFVGLGAALYLVLHRATQTQRSNTMRGAA